MIIVVTEVVWGEPESANTPETRSVVYNIISYM